MQLSYTVVIIGRTNVGKSTLFNRLTKTRDALVANYPGLTRDRHYGTMVIHGRHLTLVDTGGIETATTPMVQLTLKQTELALAEADLVLFVVDGHGGLTHGDELLAKKLRKLAKPLLLVINKIDIDGGQNQREDFHSLGFASMVTISAEHNRGIANLRQHIADKLPSLDTETSDISPDTIKIALLGKPNGGKSTLANFLLKEERVIAHDQPGTTRDSLAMDFSYRGKNYTIIDTAGIRRRSRITDPIEKFSIAKTLGAIATSDVVLLLIDATENIADQDLKLINLTLDEGKALVIAINKWDNLASLQKDKIKSELERRLEFIDFVDVHFISALHGSGVGNLFKSIDRGYLGAKKTLPTAELNKILAMAVTNNPPPMVQGREVKLRYAHLGHHSPPTVIIHGTRVSSLPENYRRYLEKFLRRALDLSGTPIKIIFKAKN